MDSDQLIFLSREEVKSLLEWDWLVEKIEQAFRSTSDGSGHQLSRISLRHKDGLFALMPGFVESKQNNETDNGQLLVLKTLNIFTRPGLPPLVATIFVFDISTTGHLKCVMDGEEITGWRTAAASAIVTKNIYKNFPSNKTDVLAVFGAGVQAKCHIECYQHLFKFKEVRIWARNVKQGEKLVADLKTANVCGNIKYSSSKQECATNADVIITTTTSPVPLVQYSWLKPNAHIVSIGVSPGSRVNELDLEIYRHAWLCVDSIATANSDLPILKEANAVISGEVGDILTGKVSLPPSNKITIFHSLGMAVEDVVTAETVYKKYVSKLQST